MGGAGLQNRGTTLGSLGTCHLQQRQGACSQNHRVNKDQTKAGTRASWDTPHPTPRPDLAQSRSVPSDPNCCGRGGDVGVRGLEESACSGAVSLTILG